MIKKAFITFQFLLIIGVLAMVIVASGYAADQAPAIESRYFSIYTPKEIDLNQLSDQLGLSMLLSNEESWLPADKASGLVGDGVDVMLEEVSEILGLNTHDFNCKIKIFSSDDKLKDELDSIFGIKEGQEAIYFYHQKSAFYYNQNDTIYISMENISMGVISHEMAHALISKYFVVPPPERIQEILAGYVEFSLKKSVSQR